MGSREPKHLSCPTHGAVWGTIYADGAVDYDCGCHATPTPPAPADDASGAEAMRERAAKVAETHYLQPCPTLCGQSIATAIRALPLPPATGDATRVPARDDAVEEARDAVALLADARKCVALVNTNGYYDVWLARCDRVMADALRREKGGA